MAQVTFDFTGAPPAQGGGGVDVVPPGKYMLRLVDFEDGLTSRKDKRMVKTKWEVASGDFEGKSLRDNFVLGGEGIFGMQRLHACLLALNVKVGERSITFESTRLIGQTCVAVVQDGVMPANGDYPERAISEIRSYHSLAEVQAAQAAKAAAASAPPVAIAAPAAPAPVAANEEDPFGEEPAAPVAAAPAAKRATKATAVAEPPADLGKEIDDLFD